MAVGHKKRLTAIFCGYSCQSLLILWLTKNHLNMREKLFFCCRIFTDFGYRYAADAPVICINLVDGDNGGGFVFA